MSQARNWCFTLNNPAQTSDELIESVSLNPDFRYVIFQLEQAETGTRHFQGYIEFKRPVRLSQIKALLPRAHLEARKGTARQAIDYASKTDTRVDGPFSSGEPSSTGQGHRRDLSDAIVSLSSGGVASLISDHPETFVRHGNGLLRLHLFKSILDTPKTREAPQVVLSFGPPGCGKSSHFYTLFPTGFTLPLSADIWFDGYLGQREVVLDDFCGSASRLSLDLLLKLIDRYVQTVPIKGAFVSFAPDVIHITSNIHPSAWYDYTSRRPHYDALMRRISTVQWWSSRDAIPLVIHNPGNPVGLDSIVAEAAAYKESHSADFASDVFDLSVPVIPANQLGYFDDLLPPPLLPRYDNVEEYIVQLKRSYLDKFAYFCNPPEHAGYCF